VHDQRDWLLEDDRSMEPDDTAETYDTAQASASTCETTHNYTYNTAH